MKQHPPEIQARIDEAIREYIQEFAAAWLRSHQVYFDIHHPL